MHSEAPSDHFHQDQQTKQKTRAHMDKHKRDWKNIEASTESRELANKV